MIVTTLAVTLAVILVLIIGYVVGRQTEFKELTRDDMQFESLQLARLKHLGRR